MAMLKALAIANYTGRPLYVSFNPLNDDSEFYFTRTNPKGHDPQGSVDVARTAYNLNTDSGPIEIENISWKAELGPCGPEGPKGKETFLHLSDWFYQGSAVWFGNRSPFIAPKGAGFKVTFTDTSTTDVKSALQFTIQIPAVGSLSHSIISGEQVWRERNALENAAEDFANDFGKHSDKSGENVKRGNSVKTAPSSFQARFGTLSKDAPSMNDEVSESLYAIGDLGFYLDANDVTDYYSLGIWTPE